MFRRYYYIAIAIALAACQVDNARLNRTVDGLLVKGGEAFNVMNTYAVIRHDFKRGRIMRARARVLAMSRANPDYQQAHQLLDHKIEPARRRIFIHFLRLGKQLEKQQRWSEAMWAYDQAKAVTIKPEAMQQKRAEMEQHMRQLRLEHLLMQRRKEDQTLLAYAAAYTPPPGLSRQDEVYERLRERYSDLLDDRANQTFREALHFLARKKPEIAYVEIESYLRLQPGSIKGRKLLAAIKKKMPPFLHIPDQNAVRPEHHKAVARKRINHPKEVNADQIRRALKAGELLQARQLAHIYRRNGGKGAEKLLDQVEKKVKAKAATLFTRGSSAFRHEQLEDAIKYWNDAVTLAPEESEYVQSLRRAQQLQERLKLLQEAK